jgi:2,3-bisphosphoglycerate-independent phosphoglycerate mutase
MDLNIIKELVEKNDNKILLMVIDGLGGLPKEGERETELELAHTPNLDLLAKRSSCGLIDPVAPGITPGSGPGHLGIFGYDPFKYLIERGALSCAGVNFPMEEGDIGCRINFATKENNLIKDRRAGRIPTEKCEELCTLLEKKINIDGVKIFLRPEKDYRAAGIFRGPELSDEVTDTDPQKTDKPPLLASARDKTESAIKTSKIINEFVKQADDILKDFHPANTLLLRGFSKKPSIPQMQEIFSLNPVAIAVYPMYKGLSRLVGMDVIEGIEDIKSEFFALIDNYNKYDFFFLHIKPTDSAGEDGKFEEKVGLLEEIDSYIPKIDLEKYAAIGITGDHSTPALLKLHSWHPVPLILYSKTCRPDRVEKFSENDCAMGNLGRIRGVELMPLLLAHAQRLKKYGA